MTSQNGEPTIASMAVSPRIVLSLPAELLDKLTELAKNNGLSRASYMRMVLTKHVQDTAEITPGHVQDQDAGAGDSDD